MDKDLDFLINALSRSSSPLRTIYSRDELMDMRDSFITLQNLLRRNPIDINDDISCHPVRVKAGGNTDWNVPRATEMPTAVPLMKFQIQTRNVQTSARNSVSSVLLSDIRLDRKINDNDDDGNDNNFEPGSDNSREMTAECEDREASCSENFQALVPYQVENSSQELVRYSGPSESEDDELESETLCANPSCGNTSTLSFRIPVEMEYVWCNHDYNAESTTSDMTIIADGCNFILSN
ncbi:uncharacterized protein LOC117782217 [Drosophila innubila]|uniref:uncharacterized protein LOC117782217 n=1 Tax=Drosophila innubila TaxID=198719 RepID=UPI00148CFC56|nr:uncharacterized protein LOC117782217 [Drosophila innubila]